MLYDTNMSKHASHHPKKNAKKNGKKKKHQKPSIPPKNMDALNHMNRRITKTTGETVIFEEEKYMESMRSAGIEHSLAEEVRRMVMHDKHNLESTDALHAATERALLEQNEIALAAKYNLKRAIVELGPSGYPFEQYMAEVFRAYGYIANTNQRIQGKCVQHEVDIVAEQDGYRYMIECKHHHYSGAKTNVKVALYIHARFLDVLHTWIKNDDIHPEKAQAFLVTNTRMTTDAIQYAECVGMRVLAWHYPKGKSLNELIENKQIYPITMLPGVDGKIRKKLLDADIVLAADLQKYSIERLVKKTKLSPQVFERLRNEADALMADLAEQHTVSA